MTEQALAPDLQPLVQHVPAWLLVVSRLSGLFLFAPVLGSIAIPREAKVAMVLCLSFCVYPTLVVSEPGLWHPSTATSAAWMQAGGLWAMPAAMGAELLVGLTIGFGASLLMMGMQVAGHLVDQQLGLGLAGVFDPDSGAQVSVFGQFYFLTATMIFVSAGGLGVLLSILVNSFRTVPPAGFEVDAGVAELCVGLLGGAFELGFKVGAPLLCLAFLESVAMGFIMRTLPQMNILSIGFPLRVLVGMVLIVSSTAITVEVFSDRMESVLATIEGFVTPPGESPSGR